MRWSFYFLHKILLNCRFLAVTPEPVSMRVSGGKIICISAGSSKHLSPQHCRTTALYVITLIRAIQSFFDSVVLLGFSTLVVKEELNYLSFKIYIPRFYPKHPGVGPALLNFFKASYRIWLDSLMVCPYDNDITPGEKKKCRDILLKYLFFGQVCGNPFDLSNTP